MYCYHCGTVLVPIPPKGFHQFDQETGRVLEMLACPNRACELGCEANEGHQFKGWWWNRHCTRCGAVPRHAPD